MAISHADHDHPNTPVARAACRRRMILSTTHQTTENVTGDRKPATSIRGDIDHQHGRSKITVVPRTRGDGGVVQGLKNSKKPNTLIKNIGDLPDMPRLLAYGARLAWAVDWEVRIGDRFNDEEARIVIQGDKAEIALVWRDKRPTGLWAVWVRNWDSSIQHKVQSVQEAMELAHFESQAWDEQGNLIK